MNAGLHPQFAIQMPRAILFLWDILIAHAKLVLLVTALVVAVAALVRFVQISIQICCICTM